MAIHSNRKYEVIYSFLIILPLNPETLPSLYFLVFHYLLDQLRYEKRGNRNGPDTFWEGPSGENVDLMRFAQNMMDN